MPGRRRPGARRGRRGGAVAGGGGWRLEPGVGPVYGGGGGGGCQPGGGGAPCPRVRHAVHPVRCAATGRREPVPSVRSVVICVDAVAGTPCCRAAARLRAVRWAARTTSRSPTTRRQAGGPRRDVDRRPLPLGLPRHARTRRVIELGGGRPDAGRRRVRRRSRATGTVMVLLHQTGMLGLCGWGQFAHRRRPPPGCRRWPSTCAGTAARSAPTARRPRRETRSTWRRRTPARSWARSGSCWSAPRWAARRP